MRIVVPATADCSRPPIVLGTATFSPPAAGLKFLFQNPVHLHSRRHALHPSPQLLLVCGVELHVKSLTHASIGKRLFPQVLARFEGGVFPMARAQPHASISAT